MNDMWDDLDNFDNFRDPVQDAVAHIIKAHPERLGELELGGLEDLQNLLDDLYNNAPQIWSRPDGAKAYVDPKTKIVFIDNPVKPTVFIRDDYADYLLKDGFIPD